MAKDKITLALHGDVPLTIFAEAILHFSALIEALSNEIAGPIEIEWQITHLESGSAIAQIRGFSDELDTVERVVQAYSVVGKSLQENQLIPYSDKVVTEAKALTAILAGKVTEISFITDDFTSSVFEPIIDEQENISIDLYSLGAITGKVETISSRHEVRFSLYDALFDKAIKCQLDPSQAELIRDAWEKRVTVVGEIRRDLFTGHPIEIRNIRNIQIIDEVPPLNFKKARGIIPWKEGDILPEILIRQQRDG